MAKNLLRRVMAASFRRGEIINGNLTGQPMLVHEANTPSFGEPGTGDFRQPCQARERARMPALSAGMTVRSGHVVAADLACRRTRRVRAGRRW